MIWNLFKRKKRKNIHEKDIKMIMWLREHGIYKCFHDFIDRPDSVNRFTSGVLGWSWEEEFKELCRNKGFKVKEPETLDMRYDCIVNGYRVQCKYTNTDSKRIDIRNKNEQTKRRYTTYDFDVFAIKHKLDIYLIPSNNIKDENLKIVERQIPLIESIYSVKPASLNIEDFSRFKDNWNYIKTGGGYKQK